MNFLENEKTDKILIIFNSIILILVSVTLGYLVYRSFEAEKSSKQDQEIILANDTKEKEDIALLEEPQNVENEIYVDIKGAVKNPGVYKVKRDSIINDIIKLAGGLKSNASTKYTNLSKKVYNEMVITIFTTSQVSKMNNPVVEVCKSSTEDISNCQNSSIVETTTSKNETTSGNSTSTEEITIKDNKVSLNTATKEELMTLTGVGEAKAASIIEYREKNNGFKSLDELMNISGIGEKAYEKIKNNIKL